ncbi:hypothetical protein ACVW00_001010 [Marmoricola sp. URHA0025 HA25]
MSKTTGTAGSVPLRSLRLDPENPRIPDSLKSESQADLAVVLEMGFDAHAVAQSIADLGFFQGEPLLVVPGSVPDIWVVVEGNRRLTALLGLADKSIRSEFAEPERWEKVAARASMTMDDEIPVVKHPDRASTHAEVARAHVVGKLQWRPYMQARFIASRVAEGRSLQEVADLIGVTKSRAADLFRDQAVVAQAQELGLQTGEVENAFSLLTVAMSNTKLRNHVGVPLGSRLAIGDQPVPENKTGELQELLSWIFGDNEGEPVINDSRQMSQLGNVAASEVGIAALREGRSLEEAKQKVAAAGMAPRERVVQRLTAARSALMASTDDLSDFVTDPEIRGLVDDVEALVEALRNTIEESTLESG